MPEPNSQSFHANCLDFILLQEYPFTRKVSRHMIKTVFHGSTHIVRIPRFGAVRAINDFGLGFYCTEDPSLASEWSVSRGRDGYVNRYRIETNGLRILDLNNPEYCTLHWLTVLLHNRDFDMPTRQTYYAIDYLRTMFSVDYQNYDIMTGYRADDSSFSFAQDFLNGRISYEELRDVLSGASGPGSGLQFVFKSNRAFDRITFDGYEIAWSRDWFPRKASRDLDLRSSLYRRTGRGLSSAEIKDTPSGLYIDQILNEEIKPYDGRLR
ncbi:MAG: DUF3990 domain-containing protein [Clostridiales bacterium]|nr:DUF3990 domain-containing protein [Clostridiales bacterium]